MTLNGDLSSIQDGLSVTKMVAHRDHALGVEYDPDDRRSGEREEVNGGAFVDVTETARRVGFTPRTFITAHLYRDISDLSSPLCSRRERYADRLWDVLFVGRYESGRHGGVALNYRVEMPVGEKRIIMVRAVFAGYDVDPKLILMCPEEDPNLRPDRQAG